MKHAGDGALDGQFDVTRGTGSPPPQEALHGAGEAAVVHQMGERGRVRRHRRAVDPTDLRSHRVDSAWSNLRLMDQTRVPPSASPGSSERVHRYPAPMSWV